MTHSPCAAVPSVTPVLNARMLFGRFDNTMCIYENIHNIQGESTLENNISDGFLHKIGHLISYIIYLDH